MSKKSAASLRRKANRKLKNQEKQIQDRIKAIERGRIIKEEHGQKQYSLDYCIETYRALEKLINPDPRVNPRLGNKLVQKYKDIILDLITYWKRSTDDSLYGNKVPLGPKDERLGFPLYSLYYENLCDWLRSYYNQNIHQ